jgi:RNA polymerase sigma-70 factor (ECF subfamily)
LAKSQQRKFSRRVILIGDLTTNLGSGGLVSSAKLGYVNFMSREEIENLIGRTGLGDRAAFRLLYAATSAKLFGVCLRVLKNRSDAEDVLQEAYVKIWHNAARYTISGYSPMTWLIAIVRNQAIDRLRQRKPLAAEMTEANEVVDSAATPEQQALLGGETARLQLCLDKLSPGRAEAVKAAYMEGCSYQELSEKLEQPINTVRTWLRRSLISLRECLSS